MWPPLRGVMLAGAMLAAPVFAQTASEGTASTPADAAAAPVLPPGQVPQAPGGALLQPPIGSTASDAAGQPEPAAPTLVPADPILVDTIGYGSNNFDSLLLPIAATRRLLGLSFNADFTGEYQSNLLRLGDGVVRPNAHKSDFKFVPSGSVNAGHFFGRQQIFFVGTFGYDFFARNTQLNRARVDLNGGLNYRVGANCAGSLQASFDSSQSNFNNQLEATPNGRQSQNYRASAQCGGEIGLAPFASITRFVANNTSASQQNLDSRAWTYAGGLAYNAPTLGKLTLSGSYSTTNYPGRLVIDGNGQVVNSRTRSYQLGAGIARQVGSRIHTSLQLSYIGSKSNQLGSSSFGGLGFDLAVSYTPSTLLTFNLYGNRSINTQNSGFATSALVTRIGGDVRYRIGRNLSVVLAGSYIDDKYRGVVPIVGQNGEIFAPRLRDSTGFVSLGANYDLRRNILVGVEVNHTGRSSDPAIYGYSSNGAQVTLSGRF